MLRGGYKGRLFSKCLRGFFASLSCNSPTGKDVATNVEVYWPDGRSVARPLELSDLNTVMEIDYPAPEEEVTPAVEIEVWTVLCCCLFYKGLPHNHLN